MIHKLKEQLVLRDYALLVGWIIGLIVLGAIAWSFTQTVRDQFLLNAVNRVLYNSGETRRLLQPLSAQPFSDTQGAFVQGVWYSTNDGSFAFVFAFIAGGTFFPSAAILDSNGNVQEFIPLNNHGKRIINYLPERILQINARRITGLES